MEVVVLLSSLAAFLGAPFGLIAAHYAKEEILKIKSATGLLCNLAIIIGGTVCLLTFEIPFALPLSILLLLLFFFKIPDVLPAFILPFGIHFAREEPLFYLAPSFAFLYFLFKGMSLYNPKYKLAKIFSSLRSPVAFLILSVILSVMPF